MPRSHSRSRDDKDKDHKSDRKSHKKKSRRDRSESPEETEEERMLRKAKEYVKKSSKEEPSRSSRRRSRSRSRSRSPSRDDRKRSRDDRKSSKRSRYSDEEGDSDERRKSHRRKSSSKKRRHQNSEEESDDDSRRDRKKHSSRDKSSSKHHRKDDKKHKHKSSKKEDKKKDSKKDKKKEKDSKPKTIVHKPDKSKLTPLGPPLNRPPNKLLDPVEDYFSYHQSLWVWLYREEGIAFNDLTSEESREHFANFVQQYNAGHLEAAYYDEKGLPPKALEECQTTRHKWTFQTNETERKSLQMVEDGVRKLTEYSEKSPTTNPSQKHKRSAPAVAPRNFQKDEEEEDNRRRTWTKEERQANRIANKRLKEHVRIAEEEFSGGRADYGRERQLEKKRETAAKIHGAARDKDDMGVALSDNALYGDGGEGSSYQAALARERKRKAQRQESQQARIQELQQKEQDKQKAMLDMLGLAGVAPGQKIKIAPRKDN